MISFLVASMIQYDFAPKPVPESKAKYCATKVGIPYASDNFTDSEWQAFKQCILK